MFTLIAGEQVVPGYSSQNGYLEGSFGSINPTTYNSGNFIALVYISNNASFQFRYGVTSDPGSSAFAALQVTSGGGTVTYASASAFYTYAGGVAEWNWNIAGGGFTYGATYTITITP